MELYYIEEKRCREGKESFASEEKELRNILRKEEYFHAEKYHNFSTYMLIKALDDCMSTFRSERKYFSEKIRK